MKRILAGVICVMIPANLFGCAAGKTGKGLKAAGSCGEDMEWTYDRSSKTLTITGSGEMVTAERFMWSGYPIRKLVISEGVTSIADEAFYSNHELRGELVLPQSLREIGRFAFYGCEKLTGTLALPDGLISVGRGSFAGCAGFAAFAGCPPRWSISRRPRSTAATL